MKTIGLLGGMSWESSINYERLLNEGVRARLGGTSSADLIHRSYNFAAIEAIQEAGDWEAAGDLLAGDAAALVAAGADIIALCTNTMHRVAGRIEEAIDVPFIHLADATAAAIHRAGLDTVALLGTRYTMEQEFHRTRIEDAGLTVLVPDEPDRTMIHDVIYHELVQGIVRESSKQKYLDAIDVLIERGARGVIAGCTEIELLVTARDVSVLYFPTVQLHVERLLEIALEDDVPLVAP